MRALLPAALVAAVSAGCISTADISGFVEADTQPFPHPGTFSGALSNGILVYQINADGTGKSCFRDNFNNGRIMRSRLKYDGEFIHTEDGSSEVESISEDRIVAKHSFIEQDLRRGASVPSGCESFLKVAGSR